MKTRTDKDLIYSLLKEAKLLSELQHANILLFIGVVNEQDNLCMVTEFMSKGSVFHILHSAPSNPDSTKLRSSWSLKLKMMTDTAHGMNFLHTCDPVIIHRDLKTHNLLVNNDWVTKISDFGVSRIKEMTATMTTIGTPQWMAPEILQEEKYSEKADVFSYGVCVWEIVTGEPPFGGTHPLRVITMVVHEHYRLPIPTDCPQPLAQLLTMCWNEDPKQRPRFAIQS